MEPWTIGLFGAFIPIQFILVAAGVDAAAQALRWVGAPLGAAAGVYTAFLFMQARGRDLWQDRALPLHFLVRTVLAGSAVALVLSVVLVWSGQWIAIAHWMLVGTLAAHLACLARHFRIGGLSADGRAAARNLTGGKYREYFWNAAIAGTVAPIVLAVGLPTAGLAQVAAGLLALAGLAAYEHAYVQAGQSVPLS